MGAKDGLPRILFHILIGLQCFKANKNEISMIIMQLLPIKKVIMLCCAFLEDVSRHDHEPQATTTFERGVKQSTQCLDVTKKASIPLCHVLRTGTW